MIVPRLRVKLFFWLILGVLSTFFAEVLSGSSLFPFFDLVGWLIIFPVYFLHIIFFTYIIFKVGRPTFKALFYGGIIFGLYEAYITKVLWNPTWGDALFKLGGVAVVESIVLVLFWHPFFAFIIPLFMAQTFFTKDKTLLDNSFKRIKKWSSKKLLIIPFIFSFLLIANSPSTTTSFLSATTNTLFIFFLYSFWNKIGGRDYSFNELLPSVKGFKILTSLLIGLYLLFGFMLRPEEIPVWTSQLTIWLLYTLMIYLLNKEIVFSKKVKLVNKKRFFHLAKKDYMYVLFFLLLAPFLRAIPYLNVASMVFLWLGGGIFGAITFLKSLKN